MINNRCQQLRNYLVIESHNNSNSNNNNNNNIQNNTTNNQYSNYNNSVNNQNSNSNNNNIFLLSLRELIQTTVPYYRIFVNNNYYINKFSEIITCSVRALFSDTVTNNIINNKNNNNNNDDNDNIMINDDIETFPDD